MTPTLAIPPDWNWAKEVWLKAIPEIRSPDILDYCEKSLRLPGSARSEQFSIMHTPWIREPLSMITKRIEVNGKTIALKTMTYIKPVQSGGSTLGKAAICFWARYGQGNILYYWPTDIKADQKWVGEIHPCLKATIGDLFPDPRFRSLNTTGYIKLPSGNLWCRGAHPLSNVTSDNARYEVNEELHDEDGWIPGRHEQAMGRTTAQWSPVIINITSAGDVGGQAHSAWKDSTQQFFQVKCPGCGQFHTMRTEWKDKEPHLGGLRYDGDKCRREDGSYDYNRMESTIRFQMPCGFVVHDDPKERRPLSISGGYTEPTNTGAHLSNRGYTLEAVSVDFIPFMTLIRQKHTALRALRGGDPEPWKTYLKERECRFWNPEERPSLGRVILTKDAKKKREGLSGRAARFAALDWQKGRWSKNETPHWWMVVRDVMPNGDSMLVWEGKCINDSEALNVLKDHEVLPACVACDSSYDIQHVYPFCMANGYNAIKCEGREKGISQRNFKHADGSNHIFSEEEPLFKIAGLPPKYETEEGIDPREPMFWHASAHGMQERLAWLMGEHQLKSAEGPPVKWEIPEDVSEDYKSHMEGLEWDETKKAWREVKPRFDLRWCEGVIAMLSEMAMLVGMGAAHEIPVESK